MKRIIVSIVVLIASLNCAVAQFSQSLFNSSSQQFVEQAVKDGVVLLRQDYQLLDTLSNTRYGWNHQEVFNSIYSVGFKVEGGYVVNDRFVRPWNYDQRYRELRDTTYVPVISKTRCKSMADTVYTDVKYNPNYKRSIKDSLIYRVDSLAHERRGLRLDSSLGEKEGWLVWITSADSLLQENTQLSVVTYKHKITIEENKKEYVLPKPATSKNIVAGILVVPNNTQIGVIDFQIVGYAYQKGDDWYVVRDVEYATIPEQNSNVSLLTPVSTDDEEAENNASSKKKSKKRKSKKRK